MKSTAKLIDNIMSDDYSKCRVDLDHAINHIMKNRIAEKKKEVIAKINKRGK